jgi:hypothetical protein
MLTAARLRELLEYDPETGKFTRLVQRHRHKAGEIAGRRYYQGYTVIKVDQVAYLAHRLAWLWMMGEWPDGHIDHRDFDGENNRWANLRVVTRQENMRHRRIRNPIAMGVHQVGKRYQARITIDGIRRHLGMFATAEEATGAYRQAAKTHWGEYQPVEAAHGG